MPPSAVKTIKDLIFWQYAKIISESSHFGKSNYPFIMKKFKQLQTGEIEWSSSIREYLKEHSTENHCIYCGSDEKLTIDHILPRSRKGSDSPDNAVMVCRECNSSKGDRRLYEWKGLENKDKHHRIAEEKYLKLLFKLHEERETLNGEDVTTLCPVCDMETLCERDNTTERLLE